MIVGLGYKARSGKDTIASYLVKKHNFKQIAFADALKRGCMEIFGLTEEQVYGSLKEVKDEYWNQTPRFILQFVGTECMRNIYDKNIWVKAAGKKILENPEDNWVITDCRFPNEAAAIKEWNGILVRVDRPQSSASGGIAGHASETAMDNFKNWDYVIDNQSDTLDNLYIKVDEFVSWLTS